MYYDATSTPAINHRNGDLAFLLAHPVDVPKPLTSREIAQRAAEAAEQKVADQDSRVLEAIKGQPNINITAVMKRTGFCRMTANKAIDRLEEKNLVERMTVLIRSTEYVLFRALAGD